jgi:hypothetical protein
MKELDINAISGIIIKRIEELEAKASHDAIFYRGVKAGVRELLEALAASAADGNGENHTSKDSSESKEDRPIGLA